MKLTIPNLNNTKLKIKEQFPNANEETIELLSKDLKESNKILFIGAYPLTRLLVVMMKKVGVEVVLGNQNHVTKTDEIKLILNEVYNEQMRCNLSERIRKGKANE
jgi:hypothetical protein